MGEARRRRAVARRKRLIVEPAPEPKHYRRVEAYLEVADLARMRERMERVGCDSDAVFVSQAVLGLIEGLEKAEQMKQQKESWIITPEAFAAERIQAFKTQAEGLRGSEILRR